MLLNNRSERDFQLLKANLLIIYKTEIKNTVVFIGLSKEIINETTF